VELRMVCVMCQTNLDEDVADTAESTTVSRTRKSNLPSEISQDPELMQYVVGALKNSGRSSRGNRRY
jgi:hypothetical protein